MSSMYLSMCIPFNFVFLFKGLIASCLQRFYRCLFLLPTLTVSNYFDMYLLVVVLTLYFLFD